MSSVSRRCWSHSHTRCHALLPSIDTLVLPLYAAICRYNCTSLYDCVEAVVSSDTSLAGMTWLNFDSLEQIGTTCTLQTCTHVPNNTLPVYLAAFCIEKHLIVVIIMFSRLLHVDCSSECVHCRPLVDLGSVTSCFEILIITTKHD